MGYEFDENSVEIAEKNVNRFEIHIDSNMPLWKRIETEEVKIAIEQEEQIVAAYDDEHAEDIDPFYSLLVLPDCVSNEQGLLENKVSVKRWLSYFIKIDGSPFQSNTCVCATSD